MQPASRPLRNAASNSSGCFLGMNFPENKNVTWSSSIFHRLRAPRIPGVADWLAKRALSTKYNVGKSRSSLTPRSR